jgi:hypothetical protein
MGVRRSFFGSVLIATIAVMTMLSTTSAYADARGIKTRVVNNYNGSGEILCQAYDDNNGAILSFFRIYPDSSDQRRAIFCLGKLAGASVGRCLRLGRRN